MRAWIRRSTNALLRPLGLRVVSSDWGPRGAEDALRRARAQGIAVRQVVDVGASDGSWTRTCLRVFPDARYLLVEPQSRHAPSLTALRAQHSNVTIWQGALGSAPGELELFVHGDQSSFLPSQQLAGTPRERVAVRPLDAFLEEGILEPPDLIKADVQGFELEVLKGGTACLRTTQLLLLEVCFRRLYQGMALAHELIGAAADAGFRIYDVCSYAARPSDHALTYSDFLFAPEGSPLFANETWC